MMTNKERVEHLEKLLTKYRTGADAPTENSPGVVSMIVIVLKSYVEELRNGCLVLNTFFPKEFARRSAALSDEEVAKFGATLIYDTLQALLTTIGICAVAAIDSGMVPKKSPVAVDYQHITNMFLDNVRLSLDRLCDAGNVPSNEDHQRTALLYLLLQDALVELSDEAIAYDLHSDDANPQRLIKRTTEISAYLVILLETLDGLKEKEVDLATTIKMAENMMSVLSDTYSEDLDDAGSGEEDPVESLAKIWSKPYRNSGEKN